MSTPRLLSSIEALESRIAPATLLVSNLNDSGAGSLRQAIANANATAATDIIVFAAGLTGTIDVLTQMEISTSLVIRGPGADKIVLDGAKATRILDIKDNDPASLKSVAISGLSFLNGSSDGGGAIRSTESLVLANLLLLGNTASDIGGAVCVDTAGRFVMSGTQVLNNISADDGGGVWAKAAQGITIVSSLISANGADAGGGLYLRVDSTGVRTAAILIDRSTISANDATDGQGGGAFLDHDGTAGVARVTVRSSVVAGNTANAATGEGGGVYLADGVALLDRSTFSANTADHAGGGVGGGLTGSLTVSGSKFLGNRTTDNALSGGGALYSGVDGAVNVSRSVFTGNASDTDGGAIIFVGANLTAALTANTFAGNAAATAGGAVSVLSDAALTVQSGAFTGNSAGADGGAIFGNSSGDILVKIATFTANRGGADGGAICAANDTGVTLLGARFLQNSAADDGGAVASEGAASLLIRSAIFTDNTATSQGGAVYRTSSGTLTVERSLFQANTGGSGGGLASDGSGAVAVSTSRFFSNLALTGNGGGIELDLSAGGTIDIIGSLVSKNVAFTDGGGLALSSPGVKHIRTSTITANIAAKGDGGGVITFAAPDLTITSSRIIGNIAGDQGGGARNGTGAGGGIVLVASTVTSNIAPVEPNLSLTP